MAAIQHQHSSLDEKAEYSEVDAVAHGHSISEKGHISRRLLLAASISYVAAWNMGFNNAIIAGVIVRAEFFAKFPALVTNARLFGGLVCMYSAGGAFGNLFHGWLADKYGRKVSFICAALGTLLAAGLSAGSQNLTWLIVSRMLQGFFGWGGVSPAMVYIAELAPASHRGEFGSGIGPCLNSGFMVASFTQLGLYYYSGANSWRLPLALQVVPALVMLILMPWIPESPRWLVFQGRHAEAFAVFKKFHADKNDPEFILAREEMFQVTRQVALDKTLPADWISMFTRYRKRSIAAILVPFNNQILGPQVITNYGPGLYQAAGLTGSLHLVVASVWYVAAVVSAACWARLVDKVGRKTLLVGGTILTNLAFSIVTALYATYVDGAATASNLKAGQSALIAMFFLYVIMYEIGEPAMFLYLGEVFPSHLRAKGVALSMFSLNVTAAWLIMAFPVGVEVAGWKFFLLNIGLMCVGAALQWWILPESKGRSLEEMAAIWGCPEEVSVFEKDIKFSDVIKAEKEWMTEKA